MGIRRRLRHVGPRSGGGAGTGRQGGHDHESVEGPLANATVSFGHWMQFDRFAGAGGPNDRFQNGHQLIPRTALIKRGGTVNFIIAGFHHVLSTPGTDPGDTSPRSRSPWGSHPTAAHQRSDEPCIVVSIRVVSQRKTAWNWSCSQPWPLPGDSGAAALRRRQHDAAS